MTGLRGIMLAGALALAPAVAQAEDLTFLLINESSADLTAFHVSSSASDSWEENLMAGGYLAPGYEIDVLIADGLTTCIYDIRAEFSDNSDLEDFGVDLCDLGEYTFYD